MKAKFLTIAAAGTLLCVAAGAASATTLEDVKKKGFLQCSQRRPAWLFGHQ